MKIRPLFDRVLVKLHQNSDTSDGGIYTGQATTTFVNGKDLAVQETVGTVVAIGNGKINDAGIRRPPEANIGDVVVFSDTCGRYIDDEHKMIREGDIAFFMDEVKTVELTYK